MRNSDSHGSDAPRTDPKPAAEGSPGRRLGAIALAVVAAALAIVLAIWFLAPLAIQDRLPPAQWSGPAGSPAEGAHVLRGPDIDPTGTNISTEGVRDFIDHVADAEGVRVIEIPSGAVIRLDGPVEIPANTILRGGGELRWTSGIENAPALSVVGDNVEITGVTLTNPEELGAAEGERNYGIEIRASDVRILGNHIELFQNGIAVRQGGEYHDIVIANNRVKDVIGAGGGRNSDADSGEDRGDGIVVWGAQATITGNIVNAKDGTDARIGIHAEDTTVGNTEDAPHSAAMVSIVGNVVYGPFRRSIVSENVANVTISANTVADATWWGIAVILQSHDNIVTGNTIVHTREEADNQGQNYSPLRAPVMVYGGVERTRISNNSIVAEAGSAASAFVVTQSQGEAVPTDITVDGNTAFNQDGAVQDGFAAYGDTQRLTVTANSLAGFSANGISLNGSDFLVAQNRITGSESEVGVRIADTSDQGVVRDNLTSGVAEAVIAPATVQE